jgi:hypothetical protein
MNKRFRVALSFPGEKRSFILEVADALAARLGKERILYDEYLTAELARPNLDVYLGNLYREHAELLVPFYCADYERKEWCGVEWRQMREILKKNGDHQIMPFRFDDMPITGVLSIDGYIMIGSRSAEQVAALIIERLDGCPPKPDRTTNPSAGPAPTPKTRGASATYYLYASPSEPVATADTVFFKAKGESLVRILCSLFTREYGGGKENPVFHYRIASAIPVEEQVLLDEALETLEVYTDPDRLIYDDPPSVNTHTLAQYAQRGEKWAGLLSRRSQDEDGDSSASEASAGPNTPPSQAVKMTDEEGANAAMNLLMLLAQAYYKMLECTIGGYCHVMDLNLNQSYLWTVTSITNLLANHEALKDFPCKFEPMFQDLFPSSVADCEWQDMVAPHAEEFLSAVQRYTFEKGIHEPDEGSPGWIFIELFRPSVEMSIERATEHHQRMTAEWQKMMKRITPRPTPGKPDSPPASPPVGAHAPDKT